MTAVWLILLIPLAGIFLMALIGHTRSAGWVNVALSAVSFAVSLWLALIVYADGPLLSASRMLYIDAFNVYLVTLTAFVGLTTAIFSRPYMQHEVETRQLGRGRMRLYHSMYQGFMFAMQAALTTNNVGILWVAMEGATLATVLLVSLYRTPEAVEAAWKYFILCGVGIAQALFGTVLLHNWLPDAHSEGPTPMSAILSGLLLNVALYALVRVKMLVDGSLESNLAGHLMMGFGLLSFMVAGLFLHRQRDIKRMFSYSSIEHMGLMTFAFGIGGPIATFGALLHMTVHSLTKSAIFVTVGHAAQIAGTQTIEKIRGLIRTQPTVGWGLLLGTVAIAGFPPFGVFTSEFLVLTATMKSWPWLTVPLLVGLAIAFAGLFRHIHPMVYGDPPEGQAPVRANMLPVMIQLGLVLWLGIAIPVFLSKWFEQATVLISGSSPL